MKQFISKNLTYPKKAAEMGISGRVFVQFEVDEQGNINNVKVLRGIGGGCDEESVRIIKLMGKWIPAKQNGKPVKSMLTIPIIFTLKK